MKKILLTGGGTMGSVVPLIAVFEYLKKESSDLDFYWLGTKSGPEIEFVKNLAIPYKAIISSKLRRYFSVKTILDIALFKLSFVQAFIYLIKLKPGVVISAGSFISVPVVIAAKILGIKSLIHQQDIQPGLANKIMARFATRTTVTFEEQKKYFPQAVVVGNPVREEIINIKSLDPNTYNLEPDLPFILIIGGGTGSQQINELISKSLPELVKFCQVIHITGKNKNIPFTDYQLPATSYYHSFEFIDDNLPALMSQANLVITRAGFSILTELSFLGKPTLVIPMPHSHQELNAKYFQDKNAVKVFELNHDIEQSDIDEFIATTKDLIENQTKQKILSENIQKVFPQDSTKNLSQQILKLLK